MTPGAGLGELAGPAGSHKGKEGLKGSIFLGEVRDPSVPIKRHPVVLQIELGFGPFSHGSRLT